MIQRKSPGICIFQSALFQTNTAVIDTPDLVLVADPTWLPGEVAEIARYVAAIQAGRRLLLLFTHADYDHILGYGAFPGAETIASAAFRDNPGAEKQVAEVRAFDAQYYLQRPYALHYPHVDHVISHDGQQLQIGGTTLRFWLSPGHTAEGLFTLVSPHEVLLAGDYLSDVEFPFLYHSSEAYEATLHKAQAILDSLQPRLLVPGHGSPTGDLAQMQARVATDLQYVRALRSSAASGMAFDTERLAAAYPFWQGMASAHDDNMALVRSER